MNNSKEFETHNLTVLNRRQSDITGIDDVVFFDDTTISVHSSLGDLIIEGEELKIESFSTEKGILRVFGKINGIYYPDSAPRKKTSKKKSAVIFD